MKSLYFLLVLCACRSFVIGQTPRAHKDLSLNEIIAETQFSSDESEDVNLIWWLPNEFWRASSATDPTVSEADIEELESLITDYSILAIVKGKIGLFGGVTFEDEPTVRQKLIVSYKSQKFDEFRQYKPLAEEDLNPDLINFFAIIKPMLSNMMGAMGENFHLFVFQNDKGEALLNPYSNHEAQFLIDDIAVPLQFPISSLLKRKECPKDKELLNGTWSYCPTHGDKLINN